jgi:hypothetical protein
MGQNPNPPFRPLCQLWPAADITPQMLTPLGAMSRREQVHTARLFDHLVGDNDCVRNYRRPRLRSLKSTRILAGVKR